MTKLSEAVRAANPNGLSYRDIATEARKRGIEVGHATIGRVFNGRHGNVEDKTLQAIAAALPDADLDELRTLAGLPPQLGPYTPPKEADRLTVRQRELINELIQQLARPTAVAANEQREEGEGRDRSSAPTKTGGARVTRMDPERRRRLLAQATEESEAARGGTDGPKPDEDWSGA